jgi:hypothetical protein
MNLSKTPLIPAPIDAYVLIKGMREWQDKEGKDEEWVKGRGIER